MEEIRKIVVYSLVGTIVIVILFKLISELSKTIPEFSRIGIPIICVVVTVFGGGLYSLFKKCT